MAALRVIEKGKPPVITRSGLLRIENEHMAERMTPDGKVISGEFRKHYPHEVVLEIEDEKGAKELYSKKVSECTGKELAKNFPQSITVGCEATYFIPKGRLATLRGKAFAVPRSIIANLRQELSPKDLHNRVYHNKTYPGCMIGAWKKAAENETKAKEKAAEQSEKAAGRRPGK